MASPQIADVDFTEPGRHNACSFIINEPQCVFRQIFESTLRQRRITVENTIELISIESIKRCVAANIGVSYLPRFAVVKELECGELIELPLANSRRPLRQCALTMPEKRLARRCTLLFSVLKSVFAGIKTMPGLNPALRLLFCRLRWHARSAWFTALTNIFSVAMAFFHPRLLFLFSFFFSARLANTFFDGLPVCFSLGARVFGRNSSITRALIGSSI